MKTMTFVAACKDFFGFKPGQNLTGFMEEVKALDTGEREYFKREFLKVGYQID